MKSNLFGGIHLRRKLPDRENDNGRIVPGKGAQAKEATLGIHLPLSQAVRERSIADR